MNKELTEKEIKEFISFALGDMADPQAFTIEKNKKSGWIVITIYEGLIHAPKEIIIDEWKQAKQNNKKFENVSLCL